jgi:hypothetical protein
MNLLGSVYMLRKVEEQLKAIDQYMEAQVDGTVVVLVEKIRGGVSEERPACVRALASTAHLLLTSPSVGPSWVSHSY